MNQRTVLPIVVVDDEPIILRILSLALDPLDYPVVSLPDAEEALSLMARGLRQCWQGDLQALDESLMSRSYQEEADETLQALGAETSGHGASSGRSA